MHGPLYVDDQVLCNELEEDLRIMIDVYLKYTKKGLKVNEDRNKIIVLGGEEELV